MTVLTEDLTWRLGDTGTILNTESTSNGTFVDIVSAKGYDSAPFRTTQRDHEGDDGGYMDAEFERGRDVLLRGTFYGDSADMEVYLDQLKAEWAPSKTLIKLYHKAPGVAERHLLVKPLGLHYDWDTMRRTGCTDVEFSAFAEDPRIYEGDLITEQLGLGSSILIGFAFNYGYNLSYSGLTSVNDAITINVGGNRPTPPVLVINGPVINPQIINDTLGLTMNFRPIVINNGQTLVVDMKNKTVKFNGTVNQRNVLTAPNWFYLQPGANQLRFRATSTDPAANVQIQYRPAWR